MACCWRVDCASAATETAPREGGFEAEKNGAGVRVCVAVQADGLARAPSWK